MIFNVLIIRSLFIVGIFLQLVLQVQAQTNYQASKLSGNIILDGKLDESQWLEASKFADFVSLAARTSDQVTAQTSFRILSDEEAVYVGITCAEPYVSRLVKTPVERNSMDLFKQDELEVFLDPTGTGTSFYQFIVSSSNSHFCTHVIESGRITVSDFDPVWESAVNIDSTSWSIEMRIPMSAFYKTTAANWSENWKVNVSRQRTQTKSGELSTWSPLNAAFYEPWDFRTIGNFTMKSAKDDLRIQGLTLSLQSKLNETSYSGFAKVDLIASAEARGNYQINLMDDKGNLIQSKSIDIQTEKTQIVWDKVMVNKLGKTSFLIQAIDHEEMIRQQFYTTTRLQYLPVAIKISEPYYSNCIFPDENIPEIKGNIAVNLPADSLLGCIMNVQLIGNSGIVAEYTGSIGEFSIPAHSLANGDYSLVVKILKNGRTVVQDSSTIRKLAPIAGINMCRIDRDGNLIVNGKPWFFLQWYGGDSYGMSQALKEKHAGKQIPNCSGSINMHTDMMAERINGTDGDRITKDVSPSSTVLDVMKQRATQSLNQPNLIFHYVVDEPDYRSISPVYLKHQYDLIKKIDPYHPVFICTNDPEKYKDCADIIAPDPYTSPTFDKNGNRSMTSPKVVRDEVREVVNTGKVAPWCIPQAFTYFFQNAYADYPTFTEYRCMAFDAVINGAKGIWSFIFYDHFATPELLLGCDFVYEELSQLSPFFVASGKPALLKVSAPEDGVDAWLRTVNGVSLLMTVNLLNKPVQATISSDSLKNITNLIGYREPGTLNISNGSVIIDFEPYQVRIFTSKSIDQGLKTVVEMKTEITNTIASLKKPGNLLFGKKDKIKYAISGKLGEGLSTDLKQLQTLTDGIDDCLGYKVDDAIAWITMEFVDSAQCFNKIVLYSSTIKDVDFSIWNDAAWVSVGQVTDNTCSKIEFNLKEPVLSNQLKINITKSRTGTKPELYEVELYSEH